MRFILNLVDYVINFMLTQDCFSIKWKFFNLVLHEMWTLH